MPHVIIEHTESIAPAVRQSGLLKNVHLVVVNSGLFSADAVKSRAVSYQDVCWGKNAVPAEFAHVTVKILSGRTTEQKQQLSKAVFDALAAALPDVQKLSVDIHDMEKDTYFKR